MIKITEELGDQDEKEVGKIKITTDNKEEIIFDSYPIVVASKYIKYIHYEVQKKQSHLKDDRSEKLGVLDQVKEKALGLKDTVVDTTKEKALGLKDTVVDTTKELSNKQDNK